MPQTEKSMLNANLQKLFPQKISLLFFKNEPVNLSRASPSIKKWFALTRKNIHLGNIISIESFW